MWPAGGAKPLFGNFYSSTQRLSAVGLRQCSGMSSPCFADLHRRFTTEGDQQSGGILLDHLCDTSEGHLRVSPNIRPPQCDQGG